MVKSHFLGVLLKILPVSGITMVRKLKLHFVAFFVNFYQINMSASWPTVGGGPRFGKIPTFSPFFLADVPNQSLFLISSGAHFVCGIDSAVLPQGSLNVTSKSHQCYLKFKIVFLYSQDWLFYYGT